jgi:rhodanese-related sulfurtransferase
MPVQELQESLAARSAGANEDVQYVDVREEREEELARLPHFQLLPLSRCARSGRRYSLSHALSRLAAFVCVCL